MFLGLFGRALIVGPLFKKWSKGNKKVRALNLVSFFLIGLSWGVHLWDVHDSFGASSANVAYTLLIVVGFITNASVSLAGDRPSYYTFIGVTMGSVLVTYLADHEKKYYYVIVYMLIYVFFSIKNFRSGSLQLYSVLTAKAKSKAEQERLNNIVNAFPGYVTLWTKDLVCYMANNAILTHYPNMIGQTVEHIRSKAEARYVIKEFMESGKESLVTEIHGAFWKEDMVLVMNLQRLSDGGIVTVGLDVSELAHARKLIREQEAKAQYTAKLVSLGEMAAGIAHEVNNPLTIIQGSARIVDKLVDTTPLDMTSIKMLTGKMVETCDRISKTIRSLKALSRNGDNDPFVPVSLKTVLDQCLDICGQRFRRHQIQLRLPPLDKDVMLFGREVQLGQVLVNLLGNAIDAIKNDENPWVEIKIEKEKDFLNLFIIDSGKGIPSEIRNRIMEPFFTTKEVNHGTGLGLSISKRIIQEHKGELSLIPEAPHTTFRVRIPLS